MPQRKRHEIIESKPNGFVLTARLCTNYIRNYIGFIIEVPMPRPSLFKVIYQINVDYMIVFNHLWYSLKVEETGASGSIANFLYPICYFWFMKCKFALPVTMM